LPGIKLSRKSVILDYGCGVGKLVGDLNDAGFDAYGFEPYQKTFEKPDRIFGDWSEARAAVGQAKLITCIEVLEHIKNPDDLLRRVSELLTGDGYLLVSTDMFKAQTHGSEWYYLSPSAGHVSIYTEKSLRLLMSRHGFSSVLRMNGLVWLFRLAARRRRTWLEAGYYFSSQLRIKLGIKLRPKVGRRA
jgi:predicted TPR repeat methyltransferase